MFTCYLLPGIQSLDVGDFRYWDETFRAQSNLAILACHPWFQPNMSQTSLTKVDELGNDCSTELFHVVIVGAAHHSIMASTKRSGFDTLIPPGRRWFGVSARFFINKIRASNECIGSLLQPSPWFHKTDYRFMIHRDVAIWFSFSYCGTRRHRGSKQVYYRNSAEKGTSEVRRFGAHCSPSKQEMVRMIKGKGISHKTNVPHWFSDFRIDKG